MMNKSIEDLMSQEMMKTSKIVLEKETTSEPEVETNIHQNTWRTKMITPKRIPQINSSLSNLQNIKEVMTKPDITNNNSMNHHMTQTTINHMINNISNMKTTNNISEISNISEINNTNHIKHNNNINQIMTQNMMKVKTLNQETMKNNNPYQFQQQNTQHHNKVQSQQQTQCQQKVLHQHHQQNETAIFNRKRAMELWNLQVEKEVILHQKEDQTFCQNSLPRPLKDYLIQSQEPNKNIFDIYDLIPEFTVSSPSLFDNSSDSDILSIEENLYNT